MNKALRITRNALIATTLLGSGVVAAQGMPANQDQGQHCAWHHHASWKHDGARHDMQQRAEKRLSRLKNDLHLQSDQQDAWQQFTATLTTQMKGMRGQWQDQQQRHQGEISAPERMQHRIDAMQARLKTMKAVSDATSTFYAKLSPTQQTIFNLEFSHHHRHHHG